MSVFLKVCIYFPHHQCYPTRDRRKSLSFNNQSSTSSVFFFKYTDMGIFSTSFQIFFENTVLNDCVSFSNFIVFSHYIFSQTVVGPLGYTQFSLFNVTVKHFAPLHSPVLSLPSFLCQLSAKRVCSLPSFWLSPRHWLRSECGE